MTEFKGSELPDAVDVVAKLDPDLGLSLEGAFGPEWKSTLQGVADLTTQQYGPISGVRMGMTVIEVLITQGYERTYIEDKIEAVAVQLGIDVSQKGTAQLIQDIYELTT